MVSIAAGVRVSVQVNAPAARMHVQCISLETMYESVVYLRRAF